MRRFLGYAITEILGWPRVESVWAALDTPSVATADGPDGRLIVSLQNGKQFGTQFTSERIVEHAGTPELLLRFVRRHYDETVEPPGTLHS